MADAGHARDVQDGRVEVGRHEQAVLAAPARHAGPGEDQRHPHAALVGAALGVAQPGRRVLHGRRNAVVADEDDQRLAEVDLGQQAAKLGVQGLDVGLVDRDIGLVDAGRGIADRAQIDVVQLGRGHLERIVAAVRRVRRVERLIEEPRLVGLRRPAGE